MMQYEVRQQILVVEEKWGWGKHGCILARNLYFYYCSLYSLVFQYSASVMFFTYELNISSKRENFQILN